MTVERAFTGVFIPARLYLDRSLNWVEKLILIEIMALQHPTHGCYARNAHFAEHFGISESRVSEVVARLSDAGLIFTAQDRINGQTRLSRLIYMTDAGRGLFAPLAPPVVEPPVVTPDEAIPQPSENRRDDLRKTEGQPSENRRQENNIINNNISNAREANLAFARDFADRVFDAAGEARDDTVPEMHQIRPLLYLLQDRPDAPACTEGEVLDAVKHMAKHQLDRYGPRTMRNWRFVVRKALEFRDERLRPRPVAERPAPVGEALPDPATWDRDMWAKVLKLATFRKAWKAEWGPEPGKDGCGCPADLVTVWTERSRV